jgi:hypothetical protein
VSDVLKTCIGLVKCVERRTTVSLSMLESFNLSYANATHWITLYFLITCRSLTVNRMSDTSATMGVKVRVSGGRCIRSSPKDELVSSRFPAHRTLSVGHYRYLVYNVA